MMSETSLDQILGPYRRQITSSETRLLRPLPPSQDGLLSFSLTVYCRDRAPRYTAVSYTWGRAKPTETILLNGRPFRVRPNLWQCLYYLSRAAEHTAWTHIWVDAVCINQADDLERSDQVRRMDKTYSLADCASVWLGLPNLPDDAPCKCGTQEGPIKTLEVEDLDSEIERLGLIDRPYWSRTWVIQEFLLARDVYIHCGDTSMHLADFQHLLYRTPSEESLVDSPKPVRMQLCRAEPLLRNRHPDNVYDALRPLQHLLIQYRSSECKDQRDRVFALLGLVGFDERVLLDRFFPDYELSVDQVLVTTVAHLVQCYSIAGLTSDEIITAESRSLFKGLGVTSMTEAKLLLHRAEELDYLGLETTADLIAAIELSDRLVLHGSPKNVDGCHGDHIPRHDCPEKPTQARRRSGGVELKHKLSPHEYEDLEKNEPKMRRDQTTTAVAFMSVLVSFIAVLALVIILHHVGGWHEIFPWSLLR